MSGPFGSSQWMYSSGGFYPYEIEQSLRFNDDDSAYLSWTPAGAGNRKTWTWSGWVKRGNLGSAQTLLGANTTFVEFTSADKIQFDHNGTTVATSAVFRDPSAWYHVVVAVDTTQATAADRTEIYVNGTIQAVTGSYVSQNTDTDVNDATQHNIGANLTPAEYFDGYMAEVNFIDGTALDPTSFGEFKSGVWIPKKYTGSYGTNGFYLSFADSAAIGDDLSGNANDWTPSGLASTDVLLDSPTNNYAVLNPLSKGASIVCSEGNLKITTASTTEYEEAISSIGMTSGKWYWETTGGSSLVGLVNEQENTDNNTALGSTANSWAYLSNAQKGHNGTFTAYGATYTNSDIISVALDVDAGSLEFFKNGVSQGVAYTGISSNVLFAAFNVFNTGAQQNLLVNFGQDSSFAGNKTAQGNTDDNGVGDFYYAPPSGYLALNTANLPAPAIDPAVDDVPADYFNTVLYTGTGAAQSITGVGFQPDWTWIKGRSGATDHALYDAVRGVQEQLESNQTSAETTEATGLTAFGADGFSVGALAQLNTSAATYVAWNWLAGNGTSSNTDGTITSTVSVNQKAGFSIVSYTGNATAGATIGHGLGVTPSMIIAKNRTGAAQNWQVWQASMGDNVMQLNLTNAQVASTSNLVFTVADIDASVFKVGTNASVNGSGTDHIAYCFAEVEGFSKFGSYTGNGSADGPFVWCGFRPAWVLIKQTNASGNSWLVYDVVRDTFNPLDSYLLPDASIAEAVTVYADATANGFKVRTSSSFGNGSGSTYIFAAFAEQPFKYSGGR